MMSRSSATSLLGTCSSYRTVPPTSSPELKLGRYQPMHTSLPLQPSHQTRINSLSKGCFTSSTAIVSDSPV